MLAIIQLLATFMADVFKSRRRLEVENLFLRHQLNIALRRAPQRLQLRASDRALMAWMTRMWPSLLGLTRVVQPATILRWHRCGFRAYWRGKSRARPGRPRVERELRDLIRRMSEENPLWGAPRIHGELLKLGLKVAESTDSKYMMGHRGPPSQTWRTFLRNHAEAVAAIDLCVVPTLTFERLFAFLVLGHGRRHCIDGFHRSSRPSPSSGPRPSCVGIGPASVGCPSRKSHPHIAMVQSGKNWRGDDRSAPLPLCNRGLGPLAVTVLPVPLARRAAATSKFQPMRTFV